MHVRRRLRLIEHQFSCISARISKAALGYSSKLFRPCICRVMNRTHADLQMLPTQQLVLATYILFAIIAIENILVFHIAKWKTKQLQKQVRLTLCSRFCGHLFWLLSCTDAKLLIMANIVEFLPSNLHDCSRTFFSLCDTA